MSGKQTVSVTLKNLPAYGGWAAIEQTEGEAWVWYSTRIAYPPIVLEPAPPIA
ncbi:hypothetical protein [Agromyces badenianii]|uniref:hypothetical protein n=1 Tax=Agromyces badenianii TaxID=2080742 RepID=UPI0014052643|nr:hypothetical protein [Agromyces badenianii]